MFTTRSSSYRTKFCPETAMMQLLSSVPESGEENLPLPKDKDSQEGDYTPTSVESVVVYK